MFKNKKSPLNPLLSLGVLLVLLTQNISTSAQCVNADFENGDFTGWTGTWGKATAFDFGVTPPEWPFLNVGINKGADNAATNDATGNHFLMTTPGFDAGVGGNLLSTVYPGSGSTSVRLGGSVAQGRGESITYSYVVTAQSTNFTYHYAAVIADINHTEPEQPYFKIRMLDQAGNPVECASYDVNGLSAPTIGGFTSTGTLQWKDWSSVSVPLFNYIGQTVSITFETRVCAAGGSVGSHPAWAYIDAECDSLAIIPSSPAVCAGETVTLTAPAAQSFVWEGPGIVSGGTSQAAVVDLPGTYTVTVTTLGNTPCTYSLTAVMPGNLAGGGAVSSDSAITCVGGSATLTASEAASYLWAPGGETTRSITVSPPTTSTYTVTGFSSDCGSGTGFGQVTVNPIPTSPFTVTEVCVDAGSTITYTGNAPANAVYDWDFAGGTIISGTGQGPYSVSWPTAGAKNVTLTVSVGDCDSPPTTEAVTVNPVYDPTFSYSPTTICKTGGTNPVPTITEAGGTFSGSAGLIIDPTTGVVDLSSPLGTYTITYSHAGFCPTSSTFTIDIVDVPVADFTLSDVCKDAANPTPTFINGGTAGTFTAGAGLVFVNPIVTPGEINLATSTAGTYTVTNTVGGGGGCPQVVATATITINAIPVITIGGNTICSGATATVTAVGADTYVWNNTSTTPSIDVSPTVTTTYSVTGTTAGCSSNATGIVNVNPLPTVTVLNGNVCDGDSATIVASGAASYLWNTGSTAAALVVTPTTPTNYTVTGTTLGCSATAVSTVNVTASPVVNVDDAVICQGNSITLPATGGVSYIMVADTGFNNVSFTNSLTISPDSTIQFNAYGSTADCNALPTSTQAETNAWFTCFTQGCIGADSAIVTVTQKPIVTVNSASICIGATATLIASGGSVYDWQTGETGTSIMVTPTTVGISTYTVGDNTPNCTGAATSTVTVNPLPTVIVNSPTICEDDDVTLTASGAATYTWSNGGNGASITTTPTAPTSYTVTGTSAENCINTATASVSINPLPVISVNNDTICEGAPAILTASGNGGSYTYTWSNGGAGPTITPSPSYPSATYTVTGRDAVGCSSTAPATVTVFKQARAAFTFTPIRPGVLDPTITFTDRSSDANSWLWDFGDGADPDITQNPIHTYPDVEESYTIMLSVSNPGLCADTAERTIIIGPEFTFYIPNAFSPNDDGKNDDFGAVGGGILEFELRVFDRWGLQLFFTTDINTRWNGEYLGEPCINDSYIWKVFVIDVNKKEHSYVGPVTIIR